MSSRNVDSESVVGTVFHHITRDILTGLGKSTLIGKQRKLCGVKGAGVFVPVAERRRTENAIVADVGYGSFGDFFFERNRRKLAVVEFKYI
jgi:hypothetical protein